MAARDETQWRSQKTLAECLRYIFDNEKGTDVCFEVGPLGGETVIIRAHKWMLTSRSDYFATMFSIGMSECISEPDKPIRVEDIDAATFKDLLL